MCVLSARLPVDRSHNLSSLQSITGLHSNLTPLASQQHYDCISHWSLHWWRCWFVQMFKDLLSNITTFSPPSPSSPSVCWCLSPSPVQLELEFSLWNPDDLITRFHESWMWKGYASGVQLRSQYFVGHWTPSVHQLINQIQFYDEFSKLTLISSTTFANILISLRLASDVCIIDHEMSSS